MSIEWKDVGKALAKAGLPALGAALLGPAGVGVGRILGDMIGIDSATPEKIMEAVESGKLTPELMVQLRKYEMDHKEKLEELAQRSEERDLQNLLSSRKMYEVHNTQADKIADSIMNFNLLIIAGLVLLEVFAVKLIENASMLALVCNLVGLIVGNLMTERQQVTGFFFGSSMGSKIKDKSKEK